MRIIIETETPDGTPVVSTVPGASTSTLVSADGGGAPGSPDAATAAAPPAEGILTIDAGQPSASLIAAITAAGGMTGNPALQPMDAGAAPAF